MITTRRVIAADAPQITALSRQLGYTISEEQTRQNIDLLTRSSYHEIFVAVDSQAVIGWIGLVYNFSLESAPRCEINGLVVDEQYRSRGIGNLLIEKAKEWSRGKNVSSLRLRCNIKRKQSILFYQHIGFNEIKQQKVFEIPL